MSHRHHRHQPQRREEQRARPGYPGTGLYGGVSAGGVYMGGWTAQDTHMPLSSDQFGGVTDPSGSGMSPTGGDVAAGASN